MGEATIQLMMTGMSLLDDVIKISLLFNISGARLLMQDLQHLTKLGIQVTTKLMDCTHLIAKGFIQTEKFSLLHVPGSKEVRKSGSALQLYIGRCQPWGHDSGYSHFNHTTYFL